MIIIKKVRKYFMFLVAEPVNRGFPAAVNIHYELFQLLLIPAGKANILQHRSAFCIVKQNNITNIFFFINVYGSNYSVNVDGFAKIF